MSEEEFFKRAINRICKDYDGEFAFEFESIFKKKDQEIERLNNIINKAIDFLKENACIDEDIEYFCDDLRYDDCKKLLNILKGVDKE